jgi:aspartate/methionine/tyrosine aminotransferase
MLSDISSKIPGFYVLSVDKTANKLIEDGKDVIKLNLGKSEFSMSDSVLDTILEKMRDKAVREQIDPQGLLILRKEICNSYLALSKVELSPEQIFINNGTSPMFLPLFLLMANPGDEILLPLPYYPCYVANTNIARLKPKYYSIKNGRLDLDEFKKNFNKNTTKIVVLNSPGNPLGNVITESEMIEILDIVKNDAFIISDEIYDGFVYDEKDYMSIMQYSNVDRNRVVVLNGFSKIHRMYTRRLGYGIVPEELIDPMIKINQHTLVCVDPVTQYAGYASIKNKFDIIKNEIKLEVLEYKKRLESCLDLFKGTDINPTIPDGSWYLSIDISKYLKDDCKTSLDLAQKILKDSNVAVAPGEDFGVDNIFRISLTSSRVLEGVRRIVEYLKQNN